jgi:hypothetical protein
LLRGVHWTRPLCGRREHDRSLSRRRLGCACRPMKA